MEETKKTITISAVMPAYNAEKYIARAIDSVLKQTRQPDEFIVVDDGSTDRTAEIVKGYGEKIRYVYQKNGGESAARNTGIKEACCEWIAFLDSDDEWLEENLEKLEDIITKNDDLVWAFGSFYFCNCNTKERQLAHRQNEDTKEPNNVMYVFDNYIKSFAKGYHAWTGSNIINKKVFDKVGMYVPGQHRGADTDMWLRIAYQWPKVGYYSEPLAVYHMGVQTSMTKCHRNFDIISEMIDKHLTLSAANGFGEDFLPCAKIMLSVWIRDMVSTNDTDGLFETMKRYEGLLSWRFKNEMRLRVKHPKIAPMILAITSSVKILKRTIFNLFGLRK